VRPACLRADAAKVIIMPLTDHHCLHVVSACRAGAGVQPIHSNLSGFVNRRDVCSTCQQRCNASGGQPSGNSYQSFQCVLQMRTTAVCTRVRPGSQANSWVEAKGALPELSGGSTGAGACSFRT
jgi:hypothetical protein